ncbi:MAG: trypsin-like peptidase domain-containing protein [Clostridiales bacterium]|jgi:serine protease Do|nr:trypsin-like peptidase domain-containing protein [Clostridiales bacterium]
MLDDEKNLEKQPKTDDKVNFIDVTEYSEEDTAKKKLAEQREKNEATKTLVPQPENQTKSIEKINFTEEHIVPYKKKIKRKRKFNWSYVISAIISAVVSAAMFVCLMPMLTGQNVRILSSGTQKSNLEQLAKPQDAEQSVVDIANNVGPSVVGIIAESTVTSLWGQSAQQQSSGSGIIISADGYIATNNHVVEKAESLKVTLNTGETHTAKLIGTDAKTDLAVVKIDANNLPFATLGKSSELQVGELVVAIGNPLGQEFAGSVTVGVVSALNRTLDVEGRSFTLIQTDAAINEGNSGGALINAYGQVIGINSVKVSSAEGMGFAIPIDNAKPIIDDLIANGYVKGRPAIGVIPYRDVTPEMSKVFDVPEGVYVGEVVPFSAAENAGMKPRDIIQKADGEDTSTTARLNEVRDKYKAGDQLLLEGKRLNDKGEWDDISWTVTLAEEVPEKE